MLCDHTHAVQSQPGWTHMWDGITCIDTMACLDIQGHGIDLCMVWRYYLLTASGEMWSIRLI